MWKRYFNIAGQTIVISGKNLSEPEAFPFGFIRFESDQLLSFPLFTLETGVPVHSNGFSSGYSFQFEELDLTCHFSTSEDWMEFRMFQDGKTSPAFYRQKSPVVLKMPRRTTFFSTNLVPDRQNMSEFNFLLWNAYGAAGAYHSALAIHSSVIVYDQKAVLFLGESGTGKSTHTQLWLKHIPGSGLLNDDSPIVRIVEDKPVCFGSPWSGKLACYRNESFPVAAVVRLRQSPGNKIKSLNKLEAFSALYPSCPPSFSVDAELTDCVCKTLSKIIERVPVYSLECLPDAAAAHLSFATIFN